MHDLEKLHLAIEKGDRKTAHELIPLIYDELRQLASAALVRENPGQTLEPTALVHEAFLRLVGSPSLPQWNGPQHFFAAVAQTMRRILIDKARKRNRAIHGGEFRRQEFVEDQPDLVENPGELLALDEALSKLAQADEQAAQLVNLRFFAGLSMEQAAETLAISRASAYRLWIFARAWLLDQLRRTP